MSEENMNELATVNTNAISVSRPPQAILAEARERAVALKDVLKNKKNPVVFNEEQYLEFEDWQTLGHFYNLSAKVVSTTPVQFDGVRGYEARAVVVNMETGIEISAAESMCLNDEDKWTSRTKYGWVNGKKEKVGEVPVPLFQLKSMAQTRACAKALRNVLAWVVVLAGYKPTVAEEMTGNESAGEPIQAPARASTSGVPPTPAAAPAGAENIRRISDAQRKRFYAIWKSAGKSETEVKAWLVAHVGSENSGEIPVEIYDEACAWAGAK